MAFEMSSNERSFPERNVPVLKPWLFYQLMTTLDGATSVKAFLKTLNVEQATWSPLNKWTSLKISKSVAEAIRTLSFELTHVKVLVWYLVSSDSPHLIEMTTATIFFFESTSLSHPMSWSSFEGVSLSLVWASICFLWKCSC